MNKKVNRYTELDICRSVAILLIIVNHALNTFYDVSNYQYWFSVSLFEKIFILTGYTLCRIGVPLFLMISGALILNKNLNSHDDIMKFYLKNLFPLVVTVTLWNIIYYCFSIILYHGTFYLKELLYIVFFMKNSVMPHMWYMPMIIGIYIVLPFISIIVKNVKFKSILIPLIFSISIYFIIPYLKNIFILLGFSATNIKTVIDTSFLGGVYGTYIILGYYLYNKQILGKIKSFYLIVSSLAFFLISGLMQMFYYYYHSHNIVYYNFLGIILCSIGVFEIITRFKKVHNIKIKGIIEKISAFSLGLYFLHRPLLFIMKEINFNIHPVLGTVISYIASIFISYLIIVVARQNNFINKYLFGIKS